MYPRGSNNGYGQDQPYLSQSSYAPQSLGSAALMGGVHGRSPAAVTVPPPQHYGGDYGSIYGSATQQVSPLSMKGSSTTAFDGRINYGSSMPESPKFAANDYITSSSRGYGQKVDKLYSERTTEYPLVERGQYSDRHSAYPRRDLPSETTNRYTDSVAIGREHQSKLYDHLEQATTRQEELLNVRALQSASVEGGTRQADYLASRAAIRHPAQDPIAFGGRVDHELRSLSMLTGPSYVGTHTASILGAAPQRNIDDLIYAQASSTPGYGVSLPPGRDYRIGKGLLPIESDYPTNMLGHVGHLIVDDRKAGRATYGRDMERQDKDWDYLHEREKNREREKERLRERDRERDRERLREREREREREKERERERERRERDRERDHKRRLELKHELTPVRASRDRQASSLPKDVRSVRRESPHREVLHRLHSPVKEKRREYSCKVYSYSFVESERDYMSLDKRYSRLYVSPECSKVVVYWPKNNLQLSLYTPVSFEHDFVEDATAKRDSLPTQPPADISGAEGRQTTVWNAKIILMSGLGQNAQAEMLSERTYDDRIPHFCNLLRFAVLRKNNSLMAVGGPWETVDGGDPSVDDSSLVQTALRYAKDVANLDLKNCQYWNRFLEIHYDRVGKNGLFSHKEVTVLYVPDLSNCLPSLDSWREQWFNHKKTVSEREGLHALAKEVPGDKKKSSKDKKKPEQPKDGKAEIELPKKKALSSEHQKDGKAKIEVQKRKEAIPPGQSGDDSKKESDSSKLIREAPLVSEEGKEKEKAAGSHNVVIGTEKYKVRDSNDMIIGTEAVTDVPEKVPEGNPDGQAPVAAKTGKKKIIKRIVKRKVAKKKKPTDNVTEQNDGTEKVWATESEGNCMIPEVDGQQDGSSSSLVQVKALRIVKKTVKDALDKDERLVLEEKAEKTPEGSALIKEDITMEDSNAVVEEVSTKTTVKRTVVKRVPKRKAPSPADKAAEDDLKGEKIPPSEVIKREQNEEPVEKEVMGISTKSSNSQKIRPHRKEEANVDEKGIDGLNVKVSPSDTNAKSKERKETKDVKERKEPIENESKSNKTTKEKKKSDEPPKHPGLIFQTKGNKISKVQSLSLSLDSLLNYTDKDIEESTFELSVFAESFHEMLQYEMGCQLLAFLQKLRIKFLANRNKGKRQREDTSQKENEDSSLKKRARAGNTNEDVKSKKTGNSSSEDLKSNKPENKSSEDVQFTKAENETDDAAEDTRIKIIEVPDQVNVKTIKEETKSVEQVDTAKGEDEIEEDPEEDPEEDEQLAEASLIHAPTKKESIDTEKNASNSVGPDVSPVIEQKQQQDVAKQASETISVGPSSKNKSAKVESKPKETRAVNKKLLQAFRFFDRNRAGYIRVEDLRLIIHNLGKFLSHRDVKELVQSALLESSTGRDDRILYEKLVKMPDMM